MNMTGAKFLQSGFSSVLALIVLSGCASTPSSSPDRIQRALAEPFASENREYVLGPTDVVQVSVWRNEDLSVSVPVRPDGKISVPLVGDLQASGRSPQQLADALETQLAQYIREPQVSIVVTSMGSNEFVNRVRVTGAVRQPTSVPYREGMTVLDMVLGSGGLTPFAAENDTRLFRVHEGEVVSIPVRLGDILSDGDITTNYRLRPGDIVSVPERSF